MENLDIIREKIDDIDKEIVKLFEERMNVVMKVAEYKQQNNIPILNQKREEEIINKNISRLKNKELKIPTKEFLQSLMSVSRKYQSKIIFDKYTNDYDK
ncbi:chorismate mutase [Haloimpatiens sp. FM7330]|uniref:chorismate mutase n=1 Tax=Haloimpatiens sp. FM7330 TaxID=3298610 RepID=UPI003629438E